jgi:cytoskeleton protein RodZ
MLLASLLLVGALWVTYRAALPHMDRSPAIVAPAPTETSHRLPEQIAVAPGHGQASVDAASAAAAEASPLTVLAAVESEDGVLPSTRPADSRVTLVGYSGSWLQLHSSDRTFVRSGTLAAGERLAVPSLQDLRLSTGDGGGIEILVDGRSVGFVGASGAVVRDLALAPEALQALSRPAR